MSSFQIKIVGDFCNIRCTYCRNRDFNQKIKTIMSVNTLEKLFAFLNSTKHSRIRTSWHGGEPLLAGKIFFNHILRLENIYSEKIWINAVQTNATLIDDEWAQFFYDNNFSVGVSIDGSERTHNINRINISGYGTYKDAMHGVKILRHNNIYPGVICTVTKKTFKYAEEMLLNLVNAGFKNIAFNAFYNTASDYTGDINYGLTDKEWLLFLIEIFETWLSINDPTVSVREIDGTLAWLKSKSANSCVFKGTCYQWFATDYLGNIYPCERLGKTICFGNINSINTIQNLLENKLFIQWKESIKQPPEKCQNCEFYKLCYNGCVSHRKIDGNKIPIYMYCESRINFYDYIKNRLVEKEGEKPCQTKIVL